MRLSFFASCICLAAAACTVTTGNEQTTRYATPDLAPSFVATSDGSKVTIAAQLFAHGGGSHDLELGDGDQFEATLDGAPVGLTRVDGRYEGSAPQPVKPARGLLQVLFLRTGSRSEQTASTVFVPKPFTIDSSPTEWSAKGDLAVRTSGIEATEIDVDLEGSCLLDDHEAVKVLVGGNGDVYLEGSRVHFEDEPDCDVSVYLRLTAAGAIDPKLGAPMSIGGGGGIRAVQERKLTVHVSP
jgi:hypothetical protein